MSIKCITFRYSFDEQFQQEDLSISDIIECNEDKDVYNTNTVYISDKEYSQIIDGDIEYTIRIWNYSPLKLSLVKDSGDIPPSDDDHDLEYLIKTYLEE